ncbi:helix-turn-helix domain-containing protein [Deinococcus misasensis]|uniref:helix-turn-helix domain-containing protein n=1 Tax=Deinococcus misasensis TaxID=392413 RepID=UPI00054FE3FC|nr:helix-turn-helix domain-containing protein [Deinococcus misasensis]
MTELMLHRGQSSPVSWQGLNYRLNEGVLAVPTFLYGEEVTTNLILPGESFHLPTGVSFTAAMLSKLTAVPEVDVASLEKQIGRMGVFSALHVFPGRKRIQILLAQLLDTPLADHHGDGSCTVAITHQDISALIHQIRESTSKILSDLHKEGHLEMGYRKLTVVNVQRWLEHLENE